MKILGAEIDWMKNWGNLPSLVLLIDRVPTAGDYDREMRYKLHTLPNGTGLYWGVVEEPLVKFFAHVPGRETGYGGSEFGGKLEDGTRFSVRGPWSGNSMAMNEFFPATCAVTLRTEDQKGGGFAGFHVRAGTFIHYVREAGGDVAIISEYSDRECEGSIGAMFLKSNMRELDESQPIGPYDFAIKLPGMTLAESQKAKKDLP